MFTTDVWTILNNAMLCLVRNIISLMNKIKWMTYIFPSNANPLHNQVLLFIKNYDMTFSHIRDFYSSDINLRSVIIIFSWFWNLFHFLISSSFGVTLIWLVAASVITVVINIISYMFATMDPGMYHNHNIIYKYLLIN